MSIHSLGRKLGPLFLILSLLIGQGIVLPSAIHAKDPDWTKIDQALQDAMAKNPSGKFPVIVEMEPDTGSGHGGNGNGHGNGNANGHGKRAHEALDLICQNGGEAGNSLALVGAASGSLPAGRIKALSKKESVAQIYLNAQFDATDTGDLSNVYPGLIGADKAWTLGYTGAGVTVAVLDSGVAPSNDLTQPTSRLLASVDFVTRAVMAPMSPASSPVTATTRMAL
jgi:subtilisin family serine protease